MFALLLTPTNSTRSWPHWHTHACLHLEQGSWTVTSLQSTETLHKSFRIHYLLLRNYDLKYIDPGMHSNIVFWLSSLWIFTILFDNKLHRKGDLNTKLIQRCAAAGFQPNVLQHFYFSCKTTLKRLSWEHWPQHHVESQDQPVKLRWIFS